MTSTSFNVGLQDDTKLSSRVLRPPGGGHTNIFSDEPEKPVRQTRGGSGEVTSNFFGDEPERNQQNQGNGDVPQQQEPTNGTDAPAKENVQETSNPISTNPPKQADPPRVEPPKRVRVPPGGFSSGLWTNGQSRHGMEGGGRQSRLLGRLLGRLRGEHHRYPLDKRFSLTSTNISEGCGSTTNEEDNLDFGIDASPMMPSTLSHQSQSTETNSHVEDTHFASKIDLRYSGQYLTPEQLPEFCDQLHHLVEVIRNIQSYAKITGEYPSSLERRLNHEANEVAALAAETRNARDVVERTRMQRRAVRIQRKQLQQHLAALRDTAIKELESTVRLSDRKLFKTWEALRDSSDPLVFEPLLDEIRSKQTALDCLTRLIDNRQGLLTHKVPAPPPPPSIPLPELNDDDDSTNTSASGGRRRLEGTRRSSCKRRRKDAAREPRSMPLSGEPSRHTPSQNTESCSRYRVGSAGAVTLTPFDFPSRGSVRDILFFTAT